MQQYKVSDPQGVYPEQTIDANFTGKPITNPAMRRLSRGLTKAIVVKAMAIERMFGCPLHEVDESVVLDLFRTVDMEAIERTA